MKFDWKEWVKKHFIKAEDISIDKINPNSRSYQRPLESSWIGKLIDDYKMNGFDRSKPITLNDKFQIVDGQHRYQAALEFGMINIPAVIYSFDTYTDEVMEYYRQNDWHHTHNTKMYWNARYEAKEPIAQLLYKLQDDENCYLHNDINLYGKEGPLKYKIGQALVLLNYSVHIHNRWQRQVDDKIRERIANRNYEDIRRYINLTLQFIYDCWGKDKQTAHVIYMARTFEALVRFYKILDKNHKLVGKYRNSAVKRMQSFKFDEAFRQTADFHKIGLLASHYDKFRGSAKKLNLEL